MTGERHVGAYDVYAPRCQHDPELFELRRDHSGSANFRCPACGAWAKYVETATTKEEGA